MSQEMNTLWKKLKSIFDYYYRFEKVFKQYCGIDNINNEPQHFILALVKGLQEELRQPI